MVMMHALALSILYLLFVSTDMMKMTIVREHCESLGVVQRGTIFYAHAFLNADKFIFSQCFI